MLDSMWTLAFVLAACAPPPYVPYGGDTGEDSGFNEEDTALGLHFEWPAPETAVVGCAMVVVALENVRLVDAVVRPEPVAGEGHYHLRYEGHYTPCYTPYCLIGFAESGTADVTAELVQNDHKPYVDDENEPITTNLLLNVTAGECTLGTPSAYY